MALKKHTDRTYDAELEELRSKLLTLGGKVEAEIAQSMRALTERDSKLAEQAAAGCSPCASRPRATCGSSPPR